MSGAVHPRISISTISTFNWPLDRAVALNRQLGVAGLGVLYGKAVDDPAGALAGMASAGVTCSSVTAHTSGISLIDPAGNPATHALDLLKPSLDFAAAAGNRPCYFVTGPTPPRMPTDEAFDLLVAAVAPAAAYAEKIGVPLAIEHNNPAMRDTGFMSSLHDAIEFSQVTGLGVCLELQNCWIERHLPQLFREHIGRFKVVQVSDFLVGENPRMNRRVLGDGSIPLEWLMGLLLDAGYAGWFDIETLGPAIEAEGYETSLKRSVDWLNERLVRWGV